MSKLNIVVTGGTKGIGRAIVELFAENGFDVAFCARNEDEVLALATELQQHTSVEVIAMVCDVTKKDQLQAFAACISDTWGRIDILVNNAGVFLLGSILEEEDGTLEQQLDTNIISAYYLTRFLKGLMIPYRSGHVFNICSVASLKAYPNGGSYSISKFAMYGFSQSLREELKGDNIRVTSVMPGATLTNSWSGTELPEERFMTADDVADAVFGCWQLSDRSVVEELVIRPMLGDI